MINWIRNLISNKEQIETTGWKTENSIFRFLSENVDISGKLKEIADDLPDENANNSDENKLRFASGMMDALLAEDDSDDSKEKVEKLSSLIVNIARNGNPESASRFYNMVSSGDGVTGIIDTFLDRIAKDALSVEPYLLKFASDLAFRTNHRNAVKFGISLLGRCHDKSVLDQIKILGLHDEFTLFSTVAIMNISDDVVNDLWELSKKVDGWGRIQLVQRLCELDLEEKHKDWLVREGYKNNIMLEYLAYSCAWKGELHLKLEDKIDRDLFKSAGEIIEALISGGPAEDMSDYIYASTVVENYLIHAKEHTQDLEDFLVMNRIKDFLAEIQDDMSAHAQNGWTQDIISNCIIDVLEVINSRDWVEQTYQALNSEDKSDYWKGEQAARILKLDIWDIVWKKINEDPEDSGLWYDILKLTKSDKVDIVLNYAIKVLPLKEMAVGPKDSLGLGPEFMKHMPLDYLMNFLERHPGKGEQLVMTALNSPVTRNRNMAIRALDNWKRENWSEVILEQLNKLQKIEPNSNTKANINRLLRGEVLI